MVVGPRGFAPRAAAYGRDRRGTNMVGRSPERGHKQSPPTTASRLQRSGRFLAFTLIPLLTYVHLDVTIPLPWRGDAAHVKI